MLSRHDLPQILEEALKYLGGQGTIVEVCRYIWENYEKELRESNDLFYTWQYDIRWAATALRKANKMHSAEMSPTGTWQLTQNVI